MADSNWKSENAWWMLYEVSSPAISLAGIITNPNLEKYKMTVISIEIMQGIDL